MDRGRTALVLSEIMTKSQSAVEKTRARSLSSQWRVRIRSMESIGSGGERRRSSPRPPPPHCLFRFSRGWPCGGSFSQPVAGGDPPGLLGGARRRAERKELGQPPTKGLDVVQGLHVARHGEGDPPGLLRDDEHDRVRLL